MALTVEIISQFHEKFAEDFELFFAGLYDENKAATVIGDLCQFITNEYVEKIIFGYINEDGIIETKVAYEIDTKSKSIHSLGKEITKKPLEFSEDKRQRILTLELSKKFIHLDRENTLDFLRNSLFNDWSYLVDLGLGELQKRELYFSKGPLAIKRRINNGEI